MKCLLLLAVSFLVAGSAARAETNPLLEEWKTPFGAPPFDRIEAAHYAPAIREGMRRQREAIAAVAADPAAPTFENTIEALEQSGELLARVGNVFRAMTSANTSDEIQAIARELAPEQSAHADAILFDGKLFARVKALHDARENLSLTPEQRRLLDRWYRDFVRGGALLDEAGKGRLSEINGELSVLGLRFAENVLKETNAFELVIDSKSDLAGLPPAVVEAAAEAAARRGREGAWLFTLHKPSIVPFLQYSPRRELREKLFRGYVSRGDNGGELDNNAILSRIAALRVERAKLLGYETHAHFALEESMAKEPKRVYAFLDELWTPALARARNEARSLQAIIDAEGGGFKLEPWDWWYYAEKLRKARYELDDEMIRPYFRLENVVAGAFDVATRLWGITFVERTDLPVYNAEVRVFEVKEADGSHIGILYTDYFPRDNKRGGAWCGELRGASKIGGREVAPIITNCGNFARPAGGAPSLLNFDEVTTLFHEFGHALHGLLTECTYPSLSGTAVATDFVELPSQIMENWALDPEVLGLYARHYETGGRIPPLLVEKIKNSGFFNQGFATVEYLAASYLDMDWHTLGEPKELDAKTFEAASLERIRLMPEIVTRYRSPYFSHVFGGGGGYAAGYYSYIWAEVLDADAFQAFKETSLFDRATAESFRRNILAMGGAEDPMELYKRFRGREPSIEPLLERRGLK